MLAQPAYRRALVFCALIGVPVSLAAFWFLVLLHELEHLMWEQWPHDLGWSDRRGGGRFPRCSWQGCWWA